MNHCFLLSLFVASLLLLQLPSAVSLAAESSRLPVPNADTNKVVWFRDHALRLKDNDALDAAVKSKSQLFPVYLWRKDNKRHRSPVDVKTGGTASQVFIANALNHLNQTLFGRLSLGVIDSSIPTLQAHLYADELALICNITDASEVYYQESCDLEFETHLKRLLAERGLIPRSYPGRHSLLDYSSDQEQVPWKLLIEKHPFRSPLIPFVDYVLERLHKNPPAPPKPEPMGLEESIVGSIEAKYNSTGITTKPITITNLLNTVGYAPGRNHWGLAIEDVWPASESDAARALEAFLESLPTSKACSTNDKIEGSKRTHLASRLSPYLARGLLTPRQIYHALSGRVKGKDQASFVRRIGWRDYTYAVVSLFPDVLLGQPIRDGYDALESHHVEIDGDDHESIKISNENHLQFWKDGATGFPLVDAGMRQLTTEGWMPQKVRLAVSTCLVEGLGVSWEDGMKHFADYLVDYDPAINVNMWMNAGCVGLDPYYVGTDYKRRPYWDRDGEYVRKWCPELKRLPDAWEMAEAQRGIGTFKVDCLYEPWAAPQNVLETAGVVLGETYPNRCCDEREQRKRFFKDLRSLREQWPSSRTDEKGRDLVRLGRCSNSESVGMFTPRALILSKSKRMQE